jgi:hypothetical protein
MEENKISLCESCKNCLKRNQYLALNQYEIYMFCKIEAQEVYLQVVQCNHYDKIKD